MKASLLKFLFATVLVGASIGIYQILIHKNDPAAPFKFEHTENGQVGDFGFSELNRAARIAQKEQRFENVDVDIPVMFEQYDQSESHVPIQKPSKAAGKYDPNAAALMDKSINPMFGQLPLDQNSSYSMQQYPTSDGYAYQPSSQDTGSSRHQKSTAPSKKSTQEDSPILSKIEDLKENQENRSVPDLLSDKHGRSKFRESNFKDFKDEDSKKIENDHDKKPKNNVDDENKILSDDSDANVNPVRNSGPAVVFHPLPVQSLDNPIWLIRILNKLKNWWNSKKGFDVKVSPISTETTPSKDVNPAILPPKPELEDFTKKPEQKIPSNPKVSSPDLISSEPIATKNNLISENFQQYDPPVRFIELENQKLKNNFLKINDKNTALMVLPKDRGNALMPLPKDTNTALMPLPKNTDNALIRLPQQTFEIEKVIEPKMPEVIESKKPSFLKVKRLTDEELIAKEMELLGLPYQSEKLPSIEKPYELASEQDPFGQIYFIKNSATGETLSGTAEDIQEYLENRPLWQKFKDKVSNFYQKSSNQYTPLEPSEGPAEEYKAPMTDEQRAEEAIEQLFGTGSIKTHDVTESIMPVSSSTGPASLSESISRIAENSAGEVAALASQGGALRIPA